MPAREAYAAAATEAGDRVDVIEVPGGHFEVIAPAGEVSPTMGEKVLSLMR